MNIKFCPCGIHPDECDYHKPVVLLAENIHVFDVTGTCFVPGVTNFTLENMFNALQAMPIKDYSDVYINTSVLLFLKIRKHNLLDMYNGVWTVGGYPVHANRPLHINGPFYTTEILRNAADPTLVGYFNTREY